MAYQVRVLAAVFLIFLDAAIRVDSSRGSDGTALISELPLDGTLVDSVTGLAAHFSRPSGAYMPEGTLVPADSPRFEVCAVAGGFEQWQIEASAAEFAPLAIAFGKLFATDNANRLWVSSDGVNFVQRGVLPGEVIARSSAYVTPEGALLVGLKHPGQNPLHRLWRSDDAGYSFRPVLAFPLGGWPAHWNYTALNKTLFVSEYGTKTGVSQHIYKSEDDGRTWELVYNPSPMIGFHLHKILGDPWSGHLYQAYGDDPWLGTLRSTDGGLEWTWWDSFNLPTSGLARADAIYWGSDGWGRAHVARYERETGRWSHPLRPWLGYTSDTSSGRTPTSNVYTMIDYNGIMYAPFGWKANELWVSGDGLHWAFVWAGSPTDFGIWQLVGQYAGWIHGLYAIGFQSDNHPQSYGYVRFRPGRVDSLTGVRIEPPAENLLPDSQRSSAENGLEGWEHSLTTTLTWDNLRSFAGKASLKAANTNAGASFEVRCPVLPGPVPVGTRLHSQIRITGDESVLSIRLYDERNAQWGPHTLISPDGDWTTALSEFTVAYPANAIRLVISGWTERAGNTSVWLDAVQITNAQTGSSWQVGGSPRAGEILRADVIFPAEWTDFICFRPDFSSAYSSSGWKTVKAWVKDANNYAKLVFDPIDHRFKLIEVVGGRPAELSVSEPATLQPGWTCRISMRNAADASEFRVRIGAKEVSGVGVPLSVRPTQLWIGSSPVEQDQAPGLYLLSRTFGSALAQDDVQRELEFLPVLGDLDDDGDVDLGDYGVFTDCVGGPGVTPDPSPPTTAADCLDVFDFNGDGDVDLHDFAVFSQVFTVAR